MERAKTTFDFNHLDKTIDKKNKTRLKHRINFIIKKILAIQESILVFQTIEFIMTIGPNGVLFGL